MCYTVPIISFRCTFFVDKEVGEKQCGIRFRSLNPLISVNVPEKIGSLHMRRRFKKLLQGYSMEGEDVYIKDSGEENIEFVFEDTKTWKN